MNAIGKLVKSLIQYNPHEELLTFGPKLEWAAKQFNNTDEEYGPTLKAVLLYDRKNGACPKTFGNLRTFIEHNSDNNQELVKQSEIIMNEIEVLEQEDIPDEDISDCVNLMNIVFDDGVAQFDVTTYRQAATIAAGDSDHPRGTDQRGPEAAKVFINDRNKKRMDKNRKGFGGDFVENLPVVNTEINTYIGDGAAEALRIKTGFEKIDDKILIGPKHQRWIGILGYLNHGKSGFLMSMLYNMAREGANVVFIPREFPVMEAWQRFWWMASHVFPDEPFTDLQMWKRGQNSLDIFRTKNKIMDYLQNGGLKGSIDVQNLATWPEIEEYVRARNYKKPVDVLAIDYIGHLDVEGRDTIAELNKIFRKAQLLTQNGIFNDGNGMVVITPLQANKKHFEEANEDESRPDWGLYKAKAAAVDYFSQAARDMDCLMSVWSGGYLDVERPRKLIVDCLKSRGPKFAPHKIEIHEPSFYYRDLSNESGNGTTSSDTPINDHDITQIVEDKVWEKL